MDFIVGWALAFMLTVAPPGPWYGESKDETIARYRQIAADAVSVAYEPDVAPLFSGPTGRARTAALMLSVAFHESGFRKDVDLGIGPRARGDSGQSWCLMQIMVGKGRTVEGWTGQDLVRDRTRCFRSGLEAIRRSFAVCHGNPQDELLNAYTSGSCSRGGAQSRSRIRSALRWVATHPVPDGDDATVASPLDNVLTRVRDGIE